MPAEAANLAYNHAAVGLCLSAEGAMLSSVKYMLAGLPVVSVPDRGGRNVIFDPEYCLTVEPNPEKIRQAFEMLKRRRIPPDFIRRRTLAKMAAQRDMSLICSTGAWSVPASSDACRQPMALDRAPKPDVLGVGGGPSACCCGSSAIERADGKALIVDQLRSGGA